MMWSATSLDSAATALFFATTFLRDASKQSEAAAKLEPVLKDLQAQLDGRPCAIDGQFTVVDILIGHSLGLVDRCGGLAEFPALKSYIVSIWASARRPGPPRSLPASCRKRPEPSCRGSYPRLMGKQRRRQVGSRTRRPAAIWIRPGDSHAWRRGGVSMRV